MKKFRHPIYHDSYLFCPEHSEEGALKISKLDFENFKGFKRLMGGGIKDEVIEESFQEFSVGTLRNIYAVKEEIVEDQPTEETNIPQES